MMGRHRQLAAAVSALICLGLALYGHRVGWSERNVGVFTGLGCGLLIVVVASLLLPRWWREHCEEEYASRANRDYRRRMWPAMLLYVALVFGSTWLLRNTAQSMPLRALIAVAPALPIFLLMRAFLRFLRSVDEMQRRIEMEAIGVAALVVSQVYLAGGFLQLGKVIDIPAGVAMIWVFPLMCFSYGIGKFQAMRRYR